MRSQSTDRINATLIVCVTLITLLPLRRYMIDDAFITYRYARNLIEGHGFVYNLGEQVLGTTTPGYTLLLALLCGLTHLAPPLVSWLCAIVFTSLSGILLYGLLRSWLPPLAALIGGLLYVTNPVLSFALGMETSLYTCLIIATAYTLFIRRSPVACGLCLGLAALVRPDGLVALAIPLLALATRTITWRSAALIAALAAVVLAPWLLYSFAHFGTAVPHTLAAKVNGSDNGVSPNSHVFVRGLSFIPKRYVRSNPVYALFAPLLLLGVWRLNRVRPLPALAILTWAALYLLAYQILRVPNYFLWYWAPLQIALMSVAATGIDALLEWRPAQRSRPVLALAVVAGVIGAILVGIQSRDSRDETGGVRRFYIYPTVGRYLQNISRPGQTVAAWEIGIIGYYCNRPILDLNGLVSPQVTQHGPAAAVRQVQPNYTVDAAYPGYLPIQSFPGDSGSQIEVFKK